MWMGGCPPLGYDVQDRKLVVNPSEAAQVERIFSLYAELGSVRLLQEQLAAEGILSKRRVSAAGQPAGDNPMQRGNLYGMLQNPLYRGEVAHKGNTYPGEHDPIIGEALWDRVQTGLLTRRVKRPSVASSSDRPALLTGLVFDADGQRLTPTHARKDAKRYRYYVSVRLVTGAGQKKSTAAGGLRLPAGGLDALVAQALLDLIAAPNALLDALGPAVSGASQQHALLAAAGQLAREWQFGNQSRSDPGQAHRSGGRLPRALLTSNSVGVAELAAKAGVSGSHYTRVLRLGFLAPDLLTAIAHGRQPIGLTATKLLDDTRLHLRWSEQRAALSF